MSPAIQQALDALRAERAQLDRAIAALQALSGAEPTPAVVQTAGRTPPGAVVALEALPSEPRKAKPKDAPSAWPAKVTLTSEQVAKMRRVWRETENYSKAAEAAGVSFYVARKHITTWQMEGSL